MSLPRKCIVDTNVPVIANEALNPDSDKNADCILACVEAIEHVQNTVNCLILDAGDEIFTEYRRNLSLSGQPGAGDAFMRWVHDHRWSLPEANRVAIAKDGDSYMEFPNQDDLAKFDPSDRKFVAVANKHPCHPPILQAGDSKWWNFRDILENAGITVRFLCPEYVQSIAPKKKSSKA